MRFGLIERRLIRGRINREKKITFLYVGAVLEMALHDLAGNLGLDLNGFVSSAGSDFIEIKWDVFANHFCNQCWPDWRLARFGFLNSALQSSSDGECGQDNEQQNTPPRNAGSLFGNHLHPVRLLNFRCSAIPRI